jgi:hypothetical protein
MINSGVLPEKGFDNLLNSREIWGNHNTLGYKKMYMKIIGFRLNF